MSLAPRRRFAPSAVAVAIAVWCIVASAAPAGAHSVEGGELPAPTWLLAYGGAFLIFIVGALLVATWPRPRAAFAGRLTVDGAGETAGSPESEEAPNVHVGHLLGTVVFALVVVAAIIGPDSAAANIAPLAVLVGWWVCLPIACLLLGDVMAWINPFQLPVALLQRLTGRDTEPAPRATAPPWTAAAFLGLFAWFFLAYHHPGSPRALAVMLLVYAAAAMAGGLVWGRAWLARGEGFAALSAAVAQLSWRPAAGKGIPGLAGLAVVWLGATAFDAVTSTSFWLDVLGTALGWTATALNTVGLVWLVAIVGGAYLGALRLTDRDVDVTDDRRQLPAALGIALVPMAAAWFLTHDLTLLLWDGQNLLILLSDPIGKGWDLFGTIHRDFNGRIVEATWVRWAQLALLAVGHAVAIVVAHDVALRVTTRRNARRVTWAMAALGAASVVAAVLLVLGR